MDSELKTLNELPTIENSNTKQELAILKNILQTSEPDQEKSEVANTSQTRTKLQDFYLVLVAMGLFLLFGNPMALKALSYATGNMFLAFILALILFGGILYIIYIFMP